MRVLTCTFILFTIQLLDSQLSKYNWEKAYDKCKFQNDTIIRKHDLFKSRSVLENLQMPLWSSVRGEFTPWIAYRGCYNGSVCTSKHSTEMLLKTCHQLKNNSVGNCYFECNTKNSTDGGCAQTSHFFFGLQTSICFCLCDDTMLQFISRSTECNVTCKPSIDNGECGGYGYFSVYQTQEDYQETNFGGFCLSCMTKTNHNLAEHKSVLFGIECDQTALGHCASRKSLIIQNVSPNVSTFATYWKYCRGKGLYIVGDTDICHPGTTEYIWTGLRKYKIDSLGADSESCYTIEVKQTRYTYMRRNCAEKHVCLCKHEIEQVFMSATTQSVNQQNTHSVPYDHATSLAMQSSHLPKFPADLSNSTSLSPAPETAELQKDMNAVIVGVSVAAIVGLALIVVLVCCLMRRCKMQNPPKDELQSNYSATYQDIMTVYKDTPDLNPEQSDIYSKITQTYDNQQNSSNEIDDIYVEKNDGDYDHLHTSRKNKCASGVEEERYGKATYTEDSYSSLGHNTKDEPDLHNEYHCMAIYVDNTPNCVDIADYDHCY